MDVLREIWVLLGLETKDEDFENAMLKVEAIKKGAELLVETVKETAHEVFEMFEGVAKLGAKLGDVAKQTGVSTDALQGLDVAARSIGSDFGSVTQGLKGLSLAMYRAKEGNDETVVAFQKLGVRVTTATGKLRPLDDVLHEVSEKFEKMPDGPEKLALASQVFSKAGGQFINILESLSWAQREAQESGANLTREQVKNAGQLDKALFGFDLTIQGLKNAIVGPLLEPLTEVVNLISRWIRANRALIASGIRQTLVYIGKALYVVWQAAQPIIKLFAWLAKSTWAWKVALAVLGVVLAAEVGGAILALIPTIGLLIASLGALTLAEVAAAAIPVLIGAAFLALLATIALVAQDIYTYFNNKGGKSITGAFINGLTLIADKVADILTPLFAPMVARWKDDILGFVSWLRSTIGGDAAEALLGGAIGGARNSLPLFGAAMDAGKFLAGRGMRGGAQGPASAGTSGVDLGPDAVSSRFQATFNINTTPGMDNAAVGNAVRESMDDWHQSILDKANTSAVGQFSPAEGY